MTTNVSEHTTSRTRRGLLVSFSGTMAAGKSTAIERLASRLRAGGATVRVIRFRPLYPAFHVPSVRGGVHGRPASQRRGDGEPTSTKTKPSAVAWDKPFRWYHFANNLVPLAIVWTLRLCVRKTVILFDRYFYDHYVHYLPHSLWYRLARKMTPRPDLAFVLQVDEQDLVARTEARLQDETGDDKRLPETEREKLVAAGRRYVEFCNTWPGVLVTEAHCDEHQTIWQSVTAAYDDKHQTIDTPLKIAS